MTSAVSVKVTATYFYPGSLMSESDSRTIAQPTLDAAVAAQPNDDWFAVEITATPVKTFRADDGEERVLPAGERVKVGKWYIGTEFTQPEVAALGDDYRILLSNMRRNGWATVCLTRRGNFQPIEDRDHLLAAPPQSAPSEEVSR